MSRTSDELLALLGEMEFCFWLDEGGQPCPSCGKLHNVVEKCDDCGAFYESATGCACQS